MQDLPVLGHDTSCCAPSRGTGQSRAQDLGVGLPDAAHPDVEPSGMVLIPDGSFLMGSDSAQVFFADGEGPVREVSTSAYWIDTTTVSNSEFAAFVEETGYVTEAESFGWSFVFIGLLDDETKHKHVQGHAAQVPWWVGVAGAHWRAPAGPGSSIDPILDHPVVHVSWNDAAAFAQWCGKRLPTEAEWERAARGGRVKNTFPWGDELQPGGKHMANVWQGAFPSENTCEDGYLSTAPVDAFEPNDFGLYNVSGNVWEWTADWFSPVWHEPATPTTRDNPRGPAQGQGKVTKGGSFMCHDSYCNRYRLSARTSTSPDTSLSHTGFRLVMDV